MGLLLKFLFCDPLELAHPMPSDELSGKGDLTLSVPLATASAPVLLPRSRGSAPFDQELLERAGELS